MSAVDQQKSSANALNLINSIDKLYEKPIQKLKNGTFICPVCGKSYLSETPAVKHMEQKNCHKLKDIMAGTLSEARAYAIYKDVLAQVKPNVHPTMNMFRKSPLYNGFGRFVLFCSLHEVFDPLCYMDWLNQIKGIENLPALLSAGIKEANLHEFRIFAQIMELMNSEKFYNTYRDELLSDGAFFVRSVERAKISIKWLARQDDFPFDEYLSSLPVDYQMRIEAVVRELV